MSVPLVPQKVGVATAPTPAPASRQVTRRQMVGIAVTIVLAVIIYQTLRKLWGGSNYRPTNLSEISPRELEIYLNRWKEHGPLNYNMDIHFVAQANTTDLQLEVRKGIATKLVKNGTRITSQQDLDQWTVDGQFEQIAHFVELDTSDYAKNAGWTMKNVGEFHEKLGYPADYSRQGSGDQVKYHITVTKFEEVAP